MLQIERLAEPFFCQREKKMYIESNFWSKPAQQVKECQHYDADKSSPDQNTYRMEQFKAGDHSEGSTLNTDRRRGFPQHFP